MENSFLEASLFLIRTLFTLYSIVLIIRLLCQWQKVNVGNSVHRFSILVSEPIIAPLRAVLPRVGKIDLSLVILLLVVSVLKYVFILMLGSYFVHASLWRIIVLSFADVLHLLIEVFFYAVLFVVIISWLNPVMRLNTSLQNPIIDLLYRITDPLLKPARRYIPTLGGIDLSPIAVIILLKLTTILIVSPLMRLALR